MLLLKTGPLSSAPSFFSLCNLPFDFTSRKPFDFAFYRATSEWIRARCDCLRSEARRAVESGDPRERNWQFGDRIKLAASLSSCSLAQVGKSATGALALACSPLPSSFRLRPNDNYHCGATSYALATLLAAEFELAAV